MVGGQEKLEYQFKEDGTQKKDTEHPMLQNYTRKERCALAFLERYPSGVSADERLERDLNAFYDSQVIQQEKVLKEHEGKLCLVQSQYYPEGEGSLYVHAFNNVLMNIKESRIDYIRTPSDSVYQRHAVAEGLTEWKQGGFHGPDNTGFFVNLLDTIFVLSDSEEITNLEERLKSLTKDVRQLIVEDLKGQFPDAIKIWPHSINRIL